MEDDRAAYFLFELISPEKLVFSEEVTSVVLPSASGYLTVMANHAPLVASVVFGSVRVSAPVGERLFVVWGGVADVTSSGCSLLAEAVIEVDSLSYDDLEQRILEVQAMLEGSSTDEVRQKVGDLFRQLTTVEGVSTEA